MDIRGDRRAALYQHPPSRVAFPQIPDGKGCQLRFGIGIKGSVWSRSDGVGFRILLRKNGEERLVFHEVLDPRSVPLGWAERSVELGDLNPEHGTTLIFETDVGPAGNRSFDQAGWAEPHIVCRAPGGTPLSTSPPSVVLISVDTLRADRLGVYGYAGDTSPAIDQLARESIVFSRAFSTAPWTLPSHASLFTGLLPHEHGAGHGQTAAPLGPGPPTLAEILRGAGYRTAGFSAGGLAGKHYGLARGFETWVERPHANLRSVLPEVLEVLGTRDAQPLFLFLHTYDVHGPYATWSDPSELPPGRTDLQLPEEEWQRIRSIGYHKYHELDRFHGLDQVQEAYDAGIRHIDRQLGRLFGHMRDLEIYDRSLIIVTSDHGESLYDHRFYIGHSYSLDDVEIRVPLIVRLPGAEPRGHRSQLVSLIDVAPLVLGIVGLRGAEHMSGRDPLDDARVEPSGSRVIYGEATHTGARFARSENWKIVSPAWPLSDPRSQLPESLRDRFDPAPRAVAFQRGVSLGQPIALRGPPASWPDPIRALWRDLRSMPEPGSRQADSPPVLDPEARDLLEALGYVH